MTGSRRRAMRGGGKHSSRAKPWLVGHAGGNRPWRFIWPATNRRSPQARSMWSMAASASDPLNILGQQRGKPSEMADVTVADIEAARGAARYPSLKDKAVLITGPNRGSPPSCISVLQGAKVGFIDRDRGAAACSALCRGWG